MTYDKEQVARIFAATEMGRIAVEIYSRAVATVITQDQPNDSRVQAVAARACTAAEVLVSELKSRAT